MGAEVYRMSKKASLGIVLSGCYRQVHMGAVGNGNK
jgi:hypothetical protein